MPNRCENLSERVHIELVRSLFATVAPSVIMSIGFAVAGVIHWFAARDGLLLSLTIAGVAVSAARLGFVFRYRREALSDGMSGARAGVIERGFSLTYLSFAIALGLWETRSFSVGDPKLQMLTCVLSVGYAAGVAATAGLMPRIAIPTMVVATFPVIASSLLTTDIAYLATGAMMAALLAGGIVSVLARSGSARAEIRTRITFGALARRDVLTALPNRLALREWFEAHLACKRGRDMIAVHCLDLDGFKPVNDRYGHPTGDELLRAVSLRLAHIVRSGDIVARLGGDEFAVIQSRISQVGEAEMLAQRLRRGVGTPFTVDGRELRISACVGYFVTRDTNEDLESLLAHADRALYRAKRSGDKVVGTSATKIDDARLAA